MTKSFTHSSIALAFTLVTASGCAQSTAGSAPSAQPDTKSTAVARTATQSASPGAATSAGAAEGSPRTFGAPITNAELTSLDTIAGDPAKFANKTVKTEGVVTAVCQEMGCWMEIGDQSKLAHIKMAGHSFFVPKNASGRHAIVEGTVVDTPGAGGNCMHEGKDSCAGNALAKLQIQATGVELVD
jgi:hypothetical protein